MHTSDFDFELPPELIAQRPAPAGASRLLVPGSSAPHRRVKDLPELLRPGDLLVVNDTRVIPARLQARRLPGGGRVEILLVERYEEREWDALVKPGRRVRLGTVLELDESLTAEVVAIDDVGTRRLRFSSAIEPRLEDLGRVPLPPYIRRPDDGADREHYQTVFARRAGAIAAPTAGLHFTPELLEELARRGVERTAVTLHVGIGTFKPVQVERLEDHRMHGERFQVSPHSAAAIERTRAAGGRVVAVGTTVVRTLESIATEEGGVRAGEGRTELFITPGFRFRLTDALLTNFHLPRSTLLMLVAAFAGRETVLDAYRQAVERRYRFYSYGDAMFLERGSRS